MPPDSALQDWRYTLRNPAYSEFDPDTHPETRHVARAAVRGLRRRGRTLVALRGGVYPLAEPVVFGECDARRHQHDGQCNNRQRRGTADTALLRRGDSNA